jgi:hypothetical protein
MTVNLSLATSAHGLITLPHRCERVDVELAPCRTAWDR